MAVKISNIVVRMVVAIVVTGTLMPFIARYSSASILGGYIGLRLLLVLIMYGICYWGMLRFKSKPNNVLAAVIPTFIVLLLIIPFFWEALLNGGRFELIRTQIQDTAIIFMPMVFVGLFCIDSYNWILRIAKLFSRLGVLVAVVGILQWVVGYAVLTAFGTNMEIGDGGFGANYGSAIDGSGVALFRAFSTLLNHYDVCSFLIMSSLISCYLVAANVYTLKAYAIIFVIMFIGALVTYNVTGWIIMILVNGGAFLVYCKFGYIKISIRWKLLCIPILISSAGLFSTSEFFARLVKNSNLDYGSGSSAASRYILMYNSIRLIQAHPEGWGWACNFKFLPYAITEDNYYLWIAVFGGVVYLSIYLSLFITSILYGFWSLRSLSRCSRLLCGYQIFLVFWIGGAFVCGFSNFFVAKGYSTVVFFWLSLGMIWSIPFNAGKNTVV